MFQEGERVLTWQSCMVVILMRYFLRYLEDVIATKPKVHSYHDVTAALDSVTILHL